VQLPPSDISTSTIVGSLGVGEGQTGEEESWSGWAISGVIQSDYYWYSYHQN